MKTLSLQKSKNIRFIVISVVVTTVDYLVFFLLFRDIGILLAHIVSYSIAIVLSFSLHKKFVFKLSRNVRFAFVNVLFFSLVGVVIGYAVLSFCNLFFANIVLAKVSMTLFMFFYNFYSKKVAFGDLT